MTWPKHKPEPELNVLSDATPEGIAAQAELVLAALDSVPLRRLVESVMKARSDLNVPTNRAPLAVRAGGAEDFVTNVDKRFEVEIKPLTSFRVTHLVLSPESARAYELTDMRIGNRLQTRGHEPIPMETFSVEFASDNKLSAVFKWKTDQAAPGQSLYLQFKPVSGVKSVPLRGVIWVDCYGP